MSLPVIILYGNCQANLLSSCLGVIPGVAERYQIERYLDFVYPGTDGLENPPEEILDRCELLILQMGLTRRDPEYVARLASRGTKIIRFPTTSCPPLWPQEGPDRRNHFEPNYPFGRYPYGDRVLLDLMEEGKNEEQIVDEYLEKDVAWLFSLPRVMDFWRHMLTALDNRSDIRVKTFIENKFRSRRLFYTTNHPSIELVYFLLRGIVRRAWGDGVPDSHIEFAAGMPMNQYMTPVHPSVARALDLQWSGDDTLHRHWDNGWFTHREFATRYVRWEG
jgi:hypothetical protein